MLIRYPPPPTHTVMVNKENYYGEYKGHTKRLSLISSHIAITIYFGMTLLRAHAHCICIVCAKYQKASVKALVQVDFLTYVLSKNKHNPYLIGNRKKWLSSQTGEDPGFLDRGFKSAEWGSICLTKLSFCPKINILASNFFTQMFNVSTWYK